MRSNFNDYKGLFEKYMLSESKSKSTIKAYIGDLGQIGELEFLCNVNIEDIDNEIVEKIKQEFFARSLAVKTVNRKLISLSRYLSFVSQDEDIPIQCNVKIKFASFNTKSI